MVRGLLALLCLGALLLGIGNAMYLPSLSASRMRTAVRASVSSSSSSSSSTSGGRGGGNNGGSSGGSKAGGPRPGGKTYKPKPRPAAGPRTPATSSAAASATTPASAPSPPVAAAAAAAAASSTGKQAWVSDRPEPKTARERVSFKNKVPFSDDMYATLKRAIELLSERVRADPPGQPLSKEDAAWLGAAVETIIADAKKYGPPPRPERSATPSD